MTSLFLNTSLEKIIQAICWTLVHSLWEGLVLTVLTGAAMLFTQKSKSALRYKILMILFISFLVSSVLTFFLEWNSLQDLDGNGNIGGGFISAGILTEFASRFSGYLSSNASAIVLIWFIIFCGKCVRMTGGLLYTQRIRNHNPIEVDSEWKEKFKSICSRLEMRKTVKLMQSKLVKVPIVMGHLKPVIFIPLGFLTNIPPAQMEAVIIHELAHIKRNDFITNLLQHLAETIFFFNPGLIWVSSLMREERENCCDDMALNITNNRKQFVEALISFKEYSLGFSSHSLAFPGKKNQLFERVSRIIFEKNKSLNAAEKLFSLFSIIVLCVLITISVAYPSSAKMNKPGSQSSNLKKEQGILIPQGENHFVTVQNDLKYRQKIDKDTKVHHKSIVISYYHKEITPDADKSISDGNENESQIQEDEAAAIYSGDSKEEIEKHQVEIDREHYDSARRRISEALSAPLLPFDRERPQTQLEWSDMWAKPFDKPELVWGEKPK